MSEQYLLECECGRGMMVRPRHAGETRDCPCGRRVEVPSLRGLQALPQVDDEIPAVPAIRRWTLGHGVTFAIAVPLLLISAGVAGRSLYLHRKFQMPTPTLQDVLAYHEDPIIRADIDQMTATQTLEAVWKPLLKTPRLTRVTPPHILIAEYRRQLWRQAMVGLVLVAVGLLAIMATLVSAARHRGG